MKAAEESIVPFFVKYFNKLFKEGLFPAEWTKAIIVPLHKKGDPNDMDNYRGISLLSVLGKVFTFILNKRLAEPTDSNDILSDVQAGFRKTYSTTDHIFTLYACIEKYMLRNGRFYVAYVDFSKAFDTVQHPILWNILLRTAVKGRMIRILKSMYSTIKACVRCCSSCTEYFDCLQGLKQGCLLFPTL